MSRLIVSEKPSMGRAIAAALGIKGTGKSYIENAGVIVTWCIGHLVTLMNPEDYDLNLNAWKLEIMFFFPDPFRYALIVALRMK